MYDQKVLEDLAEAIEGLDIRLGGEELVAAIALRDRLDARIVQATAAFESGGCWVATPRCRWWRGCGPMLG